MQARRFQEAVAVAGGDRDLERIALAVERQGHVDAGLAESPDAPKEPGEAAHLAAGDGEHEVAGAQASALRRPIAGEPHDDNLVLELGRVKPKPRARRTIGAAEREEIVED